MATSDAPIEISHVTLRVRDLEGVAAFYRSALGLAERQRSAGAVHLGTAERTLLVLEHAPDATSRGAKDAGLFHTAFLLPGRADLGAWLTHANRSGLSLEGAADHSVSEALYLSDPEGNGIEVYRDRPRADWQVNGEAIHLDNTPLDVAGILGEANPWNGVPEGTVVGHVHLSIGDIARAEAFWRDTMGLTLTMRFGGASFLGAGGYHHHIGVNIWRARGAGPMPANAAGLARVHLDADDTAFARLAAGRQAPPEADRISLADPWQIPVEIARKGSGAPA